MAVSPVSVNAAYQAAQRVAAASEPGAVQAVGGIAPPSFQQTLTDALHSAVGTAAELTLESVVAIRDRVIAAYQDIMKMPI
jgi:flagellar hook-basal body complex protein FliE